MLNGSTLEMWNRGARMEIDFRLHSLSDLSLVFFSVDDSDSNGPCCWGGTRILTG